MSVDVEECKAQLTKLTALLVRERRCIASLDATELAEITHEKQALADVLRPLLSALREGDAGTAELRVIATQLSTSARINMLLLKDAVEVTSARLGINRDLGTYDSHARRNQAARYGGGRAA